MKDGDKCSFPHLAPRDGCLLARRQLSVGRPDLSARQSAAEAAADARGCEAHAAGALGHHARAELHLRAPEPGHQEIRPRHDLRLRPRARRPGGRGQHLSRGHLQRDLSRHQPGRGRAAEALHAVLVSRRHSQPRLAGVPGLDPRGRRAGLFAQPRVRRGVRQSRSDRRLRRRRRRGGNRPAGHGVAFQQVSRSRPPTARCCRSCISTATRSPTRPCSRASTHEELEQLLRGYGWTPYFVEGDEPEPMHEAMAATLDKAVEQIQKIQHDARVARQRRRVRAGR